MPSELVLKFADGWSSHEPDRLASIFTEDCLYEDVVLDMAAHGRGEVGSVLTEWLKMSTDLKMTITEQFGEGDALGVEWIFSGTHDGQIEELGPTGRRFEFRGSTLFRFEGDKIARAIDYWNMATLRRIVQGG